MANTFAPFGFQHVGRLDGAMPNYAAIWAKISKSNSTPIFFGDPVTQLNTGYIAQSTAGTTQIKGILYETKYLAVSPAQILWGRFWPGSNAQNDVDAALVTDPQATFKVQANGLVTQAMIGQNANFALGTGNTITGFSGASLDVSTVANTTTLPFRIVGLYQGATAENGADQTTQYNLVYVTFNNSDTKSLTGI